MDYKEKLNEILNNANKEDIADICSNFSDENISLIKIIVDNSERAKAVLAVISTLLLEKILYPNQDIRYHQKNMSGGFSGRTIDANYVTPFFKENKFPAMSSSGWLTRSLEQPYPYDLSYSGKITPQEVKYAFLKIINEVQTNDMDPETTLKLIFALLIEQRELLDINLAKPHKLSIESIIELLKRHFEYSYDCHGASRLPSLAIFAAYECIMKQVKRYEDKILCPIASHTSADRQSGRIGDVDIIRSNGEPFEAVEIKHLIVITPDLIKDAFEKFKSFKTDRYYLLTTVNMNNADWDSIKIEVDRIAQIHGCQVIVNGVYDTLKYYLRLIFDPAEFIEKYVDLLKNDSVIKYQHKKAWNDVVVQS
ncbi:hypothetical protein [Campylobacter sp. RM16188]|uniref:hypothetical protein n=1 Tax=Campylobacter sp. RM16188 TaxID=1705725 RepID=UPI001551D496|nr:hypothetical protein [Campylobacter sp. RM16188]